MKALTHYVFSAGFALWVLSVTHSLSLDSGIMAAWLAVTINLVIDVMGHSWGNNPVRTQVAHSVFTAPFWGGMIAYASLYAATNSVLGFPPGGTFFWVMLGVLVSMGHLLLDSLTQAGVFLFRRRLAIAHFSYNNILLNVAFLMAGGLLGFLALF